MTARPTWAACCRAPLIDPVSAAERRITETATAAATAAPNTAQRRVATADYLIKSMRANGLNATLDELRAGADHVAFCPSLRSLLLALLAMPEPARVNGLRIVLSGG